MSKRVIASALGASLLAAATVVAASASPPPPAPAVARVHYGIGEPASAADIAAWNIDVEPDGRNLPPGQGTVAEGAAIYAQTCAVCHGAQGVGKPAPRLVGGFGTLATAHPVKTVGSYWPYATTVFDYIRRAMPFSHPESLSNDQVYALVAYLLHLNGIVPANAVMNHRTLVAVRMPNRDGFTWHDPRPDVHASECMQDCR